MSLFYILQFSILVVSYYNGGGNTRGSHYGDHPQRGSGNPGFNGNYPPLASGNPGLNNRRYGNRRY